MTKGFLRGGGVFPGKGGRAMALNLQNGAEAGGGEGGAQRQGRQLIAEKGKSGRYPSLVPARQAHNKLRAYTRALSLSYSYSLILYLFIQEF